MIDRRTFIAAMSAAAVTGARLHAKKIDRLGMQLYTVRTEMEKDFEGTLAKVAGVGFKEVEFAGYFDKAPKDVRAILDRHGLSAPSAHVDYVSVTTKMPQLIEAAQVVGHKFLVCPWIDDQMRAQPDVWKRLVEAFNKAGEATRKAGIQFAYHNHHFEFIPVNGKDPFDVLLEDCDRTLVKFELDLCWMAVAGRDPLVYFDKYPGRFPMVHVKGLKKLPANAGRATTMLPFDQAMPDITEVGDGPIDWKRIFAQAPKAGIQHYFVEHDQPAAPIDSITASYKYLAGLRV